jgi:hypothetical protein
MRSFTYEELTFCSDSALDSKFKELLFKKPIIVTFYDLLLETIYEQIYAIGPGSLFYPIKELVSKKTKTKQEVREILDNHQSINKSLVLYANFLPTTMWKDSYFFTGFYCKDYIVNIKGKGDEDFLLFDLVRSPTTNDVCLLTKLNEGGELQNNPSFIPIRTIEPTKKFKTRLIKILDFMKKENIIFHVASVKNTFTLDPNKGYNSKRWEMNVDFRQSILFILRVPSCHKDCFFIVELNNPLLKERRNLSYYYLSTSQHQIEQIISSFIINNFALPIHISAVLDIFYNKYKSNIEFNDTIKYSPHDSNTVTSNNSYFVEDTGKSLMQYITRIDAAKMLEWNTHFQSIFNINRIFGVKEKRSEISFELKRKIRSEIITLFRQSLLSLQNVIQPEAILERDLMSSAFDYEVSFEDLYDHVLDQLKEYNNQALTLETVKQLIERVMLFLVAALSSNAFYSLYYHDNVGIQDTFELLNKFISTFGPSVLSNIFLSDKFELEGNSFYEFSIQHLPILYVHISKDTARIYMLNYKVVADLVVKGNQKGIKLVLGTRWYTRPKNKFNSFIKNTMTIYKQVYEGTCNKSDFESAIQASSVAYPAALT